MWPLLTPQQFPGCQEAEMGSEPQQLVCSVLPLVLSGVISLIAFLYFHVRGTLCILVDFL